MVTANSWAGGGHQGPDGPRNQETERKRECQEQTCRAGAAWGEQGYAAASAPALTHSGLCPDTSEWRAIYGISHLTTPPHLSPAESPGTADTLLALSCSAENRMCVRHAAGGCKQNRGPHTLLEWACSLVGVGLGGGRDTTTSWPPGVSREQAAGVQGVGPEGADPGPEHCRVPGYQKNANI